MLAQVAQGEANKQSDNALGYCKALKIVPDVWHEGYVVTVGLAEGVCFLRCHCDHSQQSVYPPLHRLSWSVLRGSVLPRP